MRRAALLILPLAVLSACGPKTLTLSDDPVEKAATCGVVAAASARDGATNVKGALPFDQQTRIVHYALLAGATEPKFSREKAGAVVQKMQEIQEKVTSGKWKDLVGPCNSAFPEADPAKPVGIPSNSYDAQLGCYSLANFMATALKSEGGSYDDKLLAYGKMQTALDPKISVAMEKRGFKTNDAKQDERNRTLSSAAKWGSPGKVLAECKAKFG
jgi:hypothetical protein